MKLHTRVLTRVVRNLNRYVHTSFKLKCGSSCNSTTAGDQNDEGKKAERVLPPEPTYCCNTGCSNCVWIKYAQELAQLYEDGDVLARQKITEKVKDEKLRAFLFTQLGLKESY